MKAKEVVATMDLKEFVATTLVGLVQGVRSANEALVSPGKQLGVNEAGRFALNSDNMVSFDVAVTVNQESKASGGAGIQVVGIQIGGRVSETGAQGNVSRIRFQVQPRGMG